MQILLIEVGFNQFGINALTNASHCRLVVLLVDLSFVDLSIGDVCKSHNSSTYSSTYTPLFN